MHNIVKIKLVIFMVYIPPYRHSLGSQNVLLSTLWFVRYYMHVYYYYVAVKGVPRNVKFYDLI